MDGFQTLQLLSLAHMYAPKSAKIDTAIWPLTEGAYSLERHEAVQFVTADSRFNHDVGGKFYAYMSSCISLYTMYITIDANKAPNSIYS